MKAYREACAWSLQRAKPRDWKPCRVVIDVEYRAFRGCGGYHPKDLDNALASCKGMADALKDAGVVVSDAHAHLAWGEFTLVSTARKCKARGAGITLRVTRDE